MDTHVKTVGALNILYGVVALLGSLGALVLAGGLSELYYRTEATEVAIIIVGLTLLNLAMAIPCIVFGVFLGRFADWARYLGIVLSAINILNLPLGTILGGYGLWVLLSPETEMLFLHPLPHRRAKRATRDAEEDDEPEHQRSKAPVNPRESGLTS